MEETSLRTSLHDARQPTQPDGRRYQQDFNAALVEAIEESIRSLFSPQVLQTLYRVLLERHEVTRDELPYRLEMAYEILREIFGIQGGRTIARRLYEKLGLRFEEVPKFELMDYVEIAKNKLSQLANPIYRPTNAPHA